MDRISIILLDQNVSANDVDTMAFEPSVLSPPAQFGGERWHGPVLLVNKIYYYSIFEPKEGFLTMTFFLNFHFKKQPSSILERPSNFGALNGAPTRYVLISLLPLHTDYYKFEKSGSLTLSNKQETHNRKQGRTNCIVKDSIKIEKSRQVSTFIPKCTFMGLSICTESILSNLVASTHTEMSSLRRSFPALQLRCADVLPPVAPPVESSTVSIPSSRIGQ